MSTNKQVTQWVGECERLCRPDKVVWLNGSEEERARLTRLAVESGELIELNQKELPGGYLHRSAQNDVARTEKLTFICSEKEIDAGPQSPLARALDQATTALETAGSAGPGAS